MVKEKYVYIYFLQFILRGYFWTYNLLSLLYSLEPTEKLRLILNWQLLKRFVLKCLWDMKIYCIVNAITNTQRMMSFQLTEKSTSGKKFNVDTAILVPLVRKQEFKDLNVYICSEIGFKLIHHHVLLWGCQGDSRVFSEPQNSLAKAVERSRITAFLALPTETFLVDWSRSWEKAASIVV